MILLILINPFLNSFLLGSFGRFVGQQGTKLLSIFCLFINSLYVFVNFYILITTKTSYTLYLGNWILSDNCLVEWNFAIDNLTIIMLIVVNSISFLVHVYSTSYMKTDAHFIRFMSYISLFTFFMLVLIFGDNFFVLFLGWEGVGLCSYLLISFWYTRVQANKSALKAVIVNRISDFGLTLGIIFIFYYSLSIDFTISFAILNFFAKYTIFLNNVTINCYILTIISLLLFSGAVGKSAQIFLHTWLPDAMEGPTPVSALIHAATMVTAGVYLLIKCSSILENSFASLTIITFFGAITALFAATSGLFLSDIKKVIAYSTCSQLGYMIFACGISAYNVSLFHLMNHAVFKALLFLAAGAIIHSVSNEQDMRRMGNLLKILPLTYCTILIASFAITGFPFLTGFFSKDIIIENTVGLYGTKGLVIHFFASITAFFTAIYSFKILYFVFLTKTNVIKKYIKNIHESELAMSLPLNILAFGSIFIGFLFKDIIIGIGYTFLQPGYQIKIISLFETEFILIFLKLIPLFVTFFGLFILYFYTQLLKRFNLIYIKTIYKIIVFSLNRWNFDKIYNHFINYKLMYHAYASVYKITDKGILEVVGPFGIFNLLKRIGLLFNAFQTGNISKYLQFMAFLPLIYIYNLTNDFYFLDTVNIIEKTNLLLISFFLKNNQVTTIATQIANLWSVKKLFLSVPNKIFFNAILTICIGTVWELIKYAFSIIFFDTIIIKKCLDFIIHKIKFAFINRLEIHWKFWKILKFKHCILWNTQLEIFTEDIKYNVAYQEYDEIYSWALSEQTVKRVQQIDTEEVRMEWNAFLPWITNILQLVFPPKERYKLSFKTRITDFLNNPTTYNTYIYGEMEEWNFQNTWESTVNLLLVDNYCKKITMQCFRSIITYNETPLFQQQISVTYKNLENKTNLFETELKILYFLIQTTLNKKLNYEPSVNLKILKIQQNAELPNPFLKFKILNPYITHSSTTKNSTISEEPINKHFEALIPQLKKWNIRYDHYQNTQKNLQCEKRYNINGTSNIRLPKKWQVQNPYPRLFGYFWTPLIYTNINIRKKPRKDKKNAKADVWKYERTLETIYQNNEKLFKKSVYAGRHTYFFNLYEILELDQLLDGKVQDFDFIKWERLLQLVLYYYSWRINWEEWEDIYEEEELSPGQKKFNLYYKHNMPETFYGSTIQTETKDFFYRSLNPIKYYTLATTLISIPIQNYAFCDRIKYTNDYHVWGTSKDWTDTEKIIHPITKPMSTKTYFMLGELNIDNKGIDKNMPAWIEKMQLDHKKESEMRDEIRQQNKHHWDEELLQDRSNDYILLYWRNQLRNRIFISSDYIFLYGDIIWIKKNPKPLAELRLHDYVNMQLSQIEVLTTQIYFGVVNLQIKDVVSGNNITDFALPQVDKLTNIIWHYNKLDTEINKQENQEIYQFFTLNTTYEYLCYISLQRYIKTLWPQFSKLVEVIYIIISSLFFAFICILSIFFLDSKIRIFLSWENNLLLPIIQKTYLNYILPLKGPSYIYFLNYLPNYIPTILIIIFNFVLFFYIWSVLKKNFACLQKNIKKQVFIQDLQLNVYNFCFFVFQLFFIYISVSMWFILIEFFLAAKTKRKNRYNPKFFTPTTLFWNNQPNTYSLRKALSAVGSMVTTAVPHQSMLQILERNVQDDYKTMKKRYFGTKLQKKNKLVVRAFVEKMQLKFNLFANNNKTYYTDVISYGVFDRKEKEKKYNIRKSYSIDFYNVSYLQFEKFNRKFFKNQRFNNDTTNFNTSNNIETKMHWKKTIQADRFHHSLLLHEYLYLPDDDNTSVENHGRLFVQKKNMFFSEKEKAYLKKYYGDNWLDLDYKAQSTDDTSFGTWDKWLFYLRYDRIKKMHQAKIKLTQLYKNNENNFYVLNRQNQNFNFYKYPNKTLYYGKDKQIWPIELPAVSASSRKFFENVSSRHSYSNRFKKYTTNAGYNGTNKHIFDYNPNRAQKFFKKQPENNVSQQTFTMLEKIKINLHNIYLIYLVAFICINKLWKILFKYNYKWLFLQFNKNVLNKLNPSKYKLILPNKNLLFFRQSILNSYWNKKNIVKIVYKQVQTNLQNQKNITVVSKIYNNINENYKNINIIQNKTNKYVFFFPKISNLINQQQYLLLLPFKKFGNKLITWDYWRNLSKAKETDIGTPSPDEIYWTRTGLKTNDELKQVCVDIKRDIQQIEPFWIDLVTKTKKIQNSFKTTKKQLQESWKITENFNDCYVIKKINKETQQKIRIKNIKTHNQNLEIKYKFWWKLKRMVDPNYKQCESVIKKNIYGRLKNKKNIKNFGKINNLLNYRQTQSDKNRHKYKTKNLCYIRYLYATKKNIIRLYYTNLINITNNKQMNKKELKKFKIIKMAVNQLKTITVPAIRISYKTIIYKTYLNKKNVKRKRNILTIFDNKTRTKLKSTQKIDVERLFFNSLVSSLFTIILYKISIWINNNFISIAEILSVFTYGEFWNIHLQSSIETFYSFLTSTIVRIFNLKTYQLLILYIMFKQNKQKLNMYSFINKLQRETTDYGDTVIFWDKPEKKEVVYYQPPSR